MKLSNKCRPWTPQEDATLLEMRQQGKGCEQIADALCRTFAAAKCRATYLSFTPVERKERRKAKTLATAAKSEARISYREGDRAMQIPDSVIAERNHRLMAAAQRSLTSVLCGDPLPGFSALEKRA